MPDPHELIGLGLNRPASPEPPKTEDLQFERSEPATGGRTCVACKRATGATYYHVQGQSTCESCAKQIEAGIQAPPAHSLLMAALYGLGAAAAGCAIYAAVSIIFHLQLALVAILVGYMVGRAIRYGSKGLGGRPQQILAVLLTYFAVSTSYVVVAIYGFSTRPKPASISSTVNPGNINPGSPTVPPTTRRARPVRRQVSVGSIAFSLLWLAAAAPFLMVAHNPSALLSLLIIFFGISRAWKLTGRPELFVAGPYQEII